MAKNKYAKSGRPTKGEGPKLSNPEEVGRLLVEGEATSCTQLTETLGLAAQRLRQTDACWPPLAA